MYPQIQIKRRQPMTVRKRWGHGRSTGWTWGQGRAGKVILLYSVLTFCPYSSSLSMYYLHRNRKERQDGCCLFIQTESQKSSSVRGRFAYPDRNCLLSRLHCHLALRSEVSPCPSPVLSIQVHVSSLDWDGSPSWWTLSGKQGKHSLLHP